MISGSQLRKYCLYASGELILIVVGILIALQLSQWNDAAKTEARVRQTLANIRTEIQTNREQIEQAMPRRREFQRRLVEVTGSLTEADRRKLAFDVPEQERLPGWKGAAPVNLTSAMFDAAKTGALADLDTELLAELSATYAQQASANDVGRALIDRFFAIDYEARYGDVLRVLWRIQEEFFGAQFLLLKRYEQTLALIDARLR